MRCPGRKLTEADVASRIADVMVASEAALILKVFFGIITFRCAAVNINRPWHDAFQYFGRAVPAGAKPLQDTMRKSLDTATTASTLKRLSEAPRKPVVLAQTELDNDASRFLMFLQTHGRSCGI